MVTAESVLQQGICHIASVSFCPNDVFRFVFVRDGIAMLLPAVDNGLLQPTQKRAMKQPDPHIQSQ